VWSWKPRRRIATFAAAEGAFGFAFAPDGRSIAVPEADGAVALRSLPGGRRTATLLGHEDAVRATAFSADGRIVVTGSADGTARVWDARTGDPIRVLRGHRGLGADVGVSPAVESVAASRDGSTLATTGYDETARVWSAWAAPRVALLPQGGAAPNDLAFDRGGRRIVTANGDGTVRIWDVRTQREVAALDTRGYANRARFLPGGRVVAAGEGPLTIWRGGKTIATFRTGEGAVVAASPDGHLIAEGGVSRVRVRESGSGRVVATLPLGAGVYVFGLAFSPDGLVATGTNDGAVTLWRTDGTRVAVLRRGAGSDTAAAVADVAFSHDGNLVAAGANDGTVRIWDAASHRPVRALQAGTDVSSVDFSADGRSLAYSTPESTKVVDLATGSTFLTLPGVGARFAPTGRRLATATGDEVAIWDCDVCGSRDELLDLANGRDVRPLTDGERRRYLHE
jgi:WD40 repeat protein